MISFATLHVGVGHGNPCLKRYAYVQRDDAELTCLAFATCRAEIWGAYSTESRQLLIFSPLTGRHSPKSRMLPAAAAASCIKTKKSESMQGTSDPASLAKKSDREDVTFDYRTTAGVRQEVPNHRRLAP